MTRRKRLPAEAIPSLELACFGGPRDGELVTLHNLRPVFIEGELAGYRADDEPTPTDEGTYVVTGSLRLEWTARLKD
jgi:hypothetical protein